MAETVMILTARRRDELAGKWVTFRFRDQNGDLQEGRGKFEVEGNPDVRNGWKLLIRVVDRPTNSTLHDQEFEIGPANVAMVSGPNEAGDFLYDKLQADSP